MEGLLAFTYYNSPLTVAVVSWFAAQVIKTIAYLLVHREFNAERLFGAGGMPSSHSALVCSLTVSVARVSGYGSPEFAISFVLALIVMYDAMGVRRAAGLHAKEINKMKKAFDEQRDEDEDSDEKELKEFLGHTPLEVLAGALLGILIAMLFSLL